MAFTSREYRLVTAEICHLFCGVSKLCQQALVLYAFFWESLRRLKFICRRFGTLYLFHLHRQVGVCRFYTHLPAYEDRTECSETSAYELQTPGNYPEESIQHSEHGESLKSRSISVLCTAAQVLDSFGYILYKNDIFCSNAH